MAHERVDESNWRWQVGFEYLIRISEKSGNCAVAVQSRDYPGTLVPFWDNHHPDEEGRPPCQSQSLFPLSTLGLPLRSSSSPTSLSPSSSTSSSYFHRQSPILLPSSFPSSSSSSSSSLSFSPSFSRKPSPTEMLGGPPNRGRGGNFTASTSRPALMDSAWSSWESVAVNLGSVPSEVNSLTIWRAFSREGTVSSVELYDDAMGRRTGRGRVWFRFASLLSHFYITDLIV